MKNENAAIRVLSVTAILLALALLLVPQASSVPLVVKEGDYLFATHPGPRGSDVLYIADTRSGAFLVIGYDNAAKALVPLAQRPIQDAFIPRR